MCKKTHTHTHSSIIHSNSIQELSKVKLNKMTTTPFAKCECTTNDQMAKNNTIYTCIIFICLLENYVRTMHAGLMISSVNKFNFICVCVCAVCMHAWHMTHFHKCSLALFFHPSHRHMHSYTTLMMPVLTKRKRAIPLIRFPNK